MARPGNYQDSNGNTKSEFEVGDIWVRHSSKVERVTYEDIRKWIEQAKQEERKEIMERLTTIVNLPPGSEIQIVTSSAPGPIDTPKRLVEYAAKRRENDPHHLLGARDLNSLFINRHLLELSEPELSLVIASALRRSATLYWWIIAADQNSRLIVHEINDSLIAEDRDKSDAARSVIELAAIYADDDELRGVLDGLRTSRYKHFREEAERWIDRTTVLNLLRARIATAKHASRLLIDLSSEELETLATELAVKTSEDSKSSLSRALGDVMRVLWSKRRHRI